MENNKKTHMNTAQRIDFLNKSIKSLYTLSDTWREVSGFFPSQFQDLVFKTYYKIEELEEEVQELERCQKEYREMWGED